MTNFNLTAIIPNYNYASFLDRRIKSIVNQTIKPSEIIFLDDYSNDESLIVAENLLSQYDIPWRIIKNDCNQGVFKQWLKGIKLARSKYLWIAEADDYCEMDFLEKLLAGFDDENVVLAYCQSRMIDESGKEINDYYHYMMRYFDHYKWDKDYKADGIEEVEKHLCCINTIPNASSVVLNKKLIDLSSISRIANYRNNGDWLFYILCLSSYPGNKICYYSEPLNYFVRQKESVFVKEDYSTHPLQEFLEIILYLLENFNIAINEVSVMRQLVVGNLIYWPIGGDTDELVDQIMSLLPQEKLYRVYNIEAEQITSRLKHRIRTIEKGIKSRDDYIFKLENSLKDKENRHFFHRISRKAKTLLSTKWW